MGSRAASAARTGAVAAAVGRTAVTTARCGAASAGRSAAETAFAPDLDRWKNRGRTSSRFSGVRTFASSTTLVMQSRPSRRGSTISGNRWMSSAAVFR